MAPARVILPAAVRKAVVEAALTVNPLECCGLLIGSGDDVVRVTEAVPMANVADQPRRRFAIDPQAHIDVLRRFRDGPATVVGHYHSHPGGPAQPSAHDLEMAFDPTAVWLIAAIGQDKIELSAYRAEADRSRFVPLELSIAA
ncbi:MAG: M67 family metallopeptidase [Rhodospirillaceae bacterium]|nr:M67 family metallopeptidase [Rhodospirillaceae bacterium]